VRATCSLPSWVRVIACGFDRDVASASTWILKGTPESWGVQCRIQEVLREACRTRGRMPVRFASTILHRRWLQCCGAKGATDMALFGSLEGKLLRQFLPFGVRRSEPLHLSRVLASADPETFETIFRRSMAAVATATDQAYSGCWPSMAMRCGAPTNAAKAPRSLLWSMSCDRSSNGAASRGHPAATMPQCCSGHVLRMLLLRRLHCYRRCACISRPFGHTVLGVVANYALASEKSSKLFECRGAALCRAGSARRQATGPSTRETATNPRATVIRYTALAAATAFRGGAARGSHHLARCFHGKRAEKPPCAIRGFPSISRPSDCWHDVAAVIGASRTACIGSLDFLFDEDATEPEKNAPEKPRDPLRRFALNIMRSHPDRIALRKNSSVPAGTTVPSRSPRHMR